jgi:hypothetical protein
MDWLTPVRFFLGALPKAASSITSGRCQNGSTGASLSFRHELGTPGSNPLPARQKGQLRDMTPLLLKGRTGQHT